MKTLSNIKHLIVTALTLIVGLCLFSSCDKVIYDGEEDCSVTYRLKFRYDKNLKFADAFSHEVKSVRLYAFDTDEKLVWQASEQGQALASENYSINLNLAPGNYRLVAWCGLDNEESFTLHDVSPKCHIEDLHCRLNCKSENVTDDLAGEEYISSSDKDLHPLFHGMLDVTLPVNDDGGEYTYVMSLTKDTNVFRVVLQHLSGEDINADDFTFCIEDNNGWLAHDNSILKDTPVTYRAWDTYSGEAGVGLPANGVLRNTETGGRAVTTVKVAVAELTVGRLFVRDWTTYERPMLIVRTADEEKKLVASIPIIDYALMVKGHSHKQMDDQEYLDRADEYNMTFFLDNANNWVSTVIQILSWRVVVNNSDIKG